MTSYSATEIFETFSYNIGSPSLTSDKYSFDEDKPCGYTETVTIEGLPAFMEHNAASSDFKIQLNTDLTLIGSYEVTVKSEIVIPSDPAPVILSDQFTFTVYMEPCLVSTYLPTAQV